MVTQFVSKPLAPIMEEVTGGNITASYSASLKEWLGPWATGRGEEIQSRQHSLPSSSQTDLQLGCELWGEEASLFLWVSLYPQSQRLYTAWHCQPIVLGV